MVGTAVLGEDQARLGGGLLGGCGVTKLRRVNYSVY
jgi:hypothetical protein